MNLVDSILNPKWLVYTLPADITDGDAGSGADVVTRYLGKLSGANALFTSDAEYTIIAAEINVRTTVTGGASTGWAIELFKSTGPRVIAAVNTDTDTAHTWTDSEGGTQTTGLGATITAGTPKRFSFSTVKDDWRIDASDNLYLKFTPADDTMATSPAIVAGSTIKIGYVYGKVA